MRVKFWGFIFLFFIAFTVTFPQTATGISSINDSTGQNSAEILYKKAVSFFPFDMERTLYFNKLALKKVNPKTEPLLNAKINKLMGDIFEKKNSIQPAINYYLISAKIFKRINNSDNLCRVYERLGNMYYRDNYNLKNALDYYYKALEIATSLNDNSLIAEIYNNIGGILFNQNNIDEAYEYFQKALKLWETENNIMGMARAYNNIGEIFRKRKMYNKAEEYYNKSLSINKKHDNAVFTAVNIQNLGILKSETGKHKEALNYFLKSIELYKNVNDENSVLKVMLLLGKEYDILKNHEKAYNILNDVFLTAQKNNNWDLIASSAKGLSSVLEHWGNSAKALKYYKIYSEFNDSINFKKQNKLLEDLQMRFINDIKEKELSLKDKEIALLKSDKKVRQLQNSILIAGIFVLIIISVLLISRYKSQFQKERLLSIKNAELHKAQQELMELEIKSKNNDLANFALHIVEKNNFLREIRKQLKELNKYPENVKDKKINELIVTVQQNLQIQEELKEFRYKVDQTYQGFFERLKTKLPSITKNEERLCALLRLNLSSKEIAALNNTSVKAVEMSRYRLRKKCKIANNENLCDYLEKI